MAHRTPKAKAEVTGADLRNPQRYRGRNEPNVAPIGEPSDILKPGEKKAWLRFTAELPWLVESDRAILEIASALRARLDLGSGTGVGLNHLQIYSAILSKLGATPADRSRVAMPPEEDDGDEFFPATR